MADISKIEIENSVYNIKDETARRLIEDFVLYAFFDEDNNDEINFFVSKDNLHLQQIKTTNKIQSGRDPSIIYYNNKFLVACTDYDTDHDFVIYESNDLETWTKHDINVGLYDSTYQKRWAPDFFVDDNNDLYIFISKQYANTEGWGDFKIYQTKCTDINNFTFSTAQLVNLIGTTSTNHIDATCIKIDDIYHLIVKDENQNSLTLEHYISSNLTTFTLANTDFAQAGTYVEGPFVYKFKGKYVVGYEKYAYNDRKKSSYRIKISDDFTTFSNYNTMFITDLDLSHGGACVINDPVAKNIIFNKINYNFNYNYNFNLNDKKNFMITPATVINGTKKGRYLKLFSVKPRMNYKASSVIFNIYDAQRLYFNSLVNFTQKTNTLNPFSTGICRLNQLYFNYEDTNSEKSNLYGKLIWYPDTTNKQYDLYLDINTWNDDITILLDIVSANLYDEDIIIYNDIYTNTLPFENNNIRSEYLCKNVSPCGYNLYIDNGTHSTLTFQLAMRNGTFNILGHGNGTNEANTIDYTINTLNGSIGVIKNKANGTSLNISVTSYSNNIYTISITSIPNYSGFTISLPNVIDSSIIDYTLS